MSDLPPAMDCQFCDGPAEMHPGRPAVFKYQMSCAKCGMCGVPHLHYEDGSGEAKAIRSWNRLQGLIAKGRLLEATQKTAEGQPRL